MIAALNAAIIGEIIATLGAVFKVYFYIFFFS